MDEMENINIIPLVDVMLVLLTIVLTTATFVANGKIPVDLAQSSQAAPLDVDPVVITLTRDKGLYVNDQKTADVAASLRGLRPDTPVVIRADAAVAVADFVTLADVVKAQGFNRVGLEVKRR